MAQGRALVFACVSLSLLGCSSLADKLPGDYRGSLTRTDGAVLRRPVKGGSMDDVKVVRTSGGTTADGEKVSIVRSGEEGGKTKLTIQFAEGCSAAVLADGPNLQTQSEPNNRCVCPIDGAKVEGPVTVTGSFDEATNTLTLTASVVLGGPDYGGGCTYTFTGNHL